MSYRPDPGTPAAIVMGMLLEHGALSEQDIADALCIAPHQVAEKLETARYRGALVTERMPGRGTAMFWRLPRKGDFDHLNEPRQPWSPKQVDARAVALGAMPLDYVLRRCATGSEPIGVLEQIESAVTAAIRQARGGKAA